MAIVLPAYLKYLSFIVLLIAILSKYEVRFDPSLGDKKTAMLTKIATVQVDRTHVYKFITNIEKYTSVGGEDIQ